MLFHCTPELGKSLVLSDGSDGYGPGGLSRSDSSQQDVFRSTASASTADDVPLVWINVSEGNEMYENLYADHRIWMERVREHLTGSVGGQEPLSPFLRGPAAAAAAAADSTRPPLVSAEAASFAEVVT